MILIDTNVLVALVDPRDRLHRQACRDLDQAFQEPFFTTSPVLTEAYFALPEAYQRARLQDLLGALPVRPWPVDDEKRLWATVTAWLEKFAAHEPDFADGYLVALAGRHPQVRIWTYDREFRTVWRPLNGKRIRLLKAPLSTRKTK